MCIRIQISGSKAYVLGETDHNILFRLDLLLSYKLLGYEYTPSYKARRWDGRNRLLTKNLEFPVGLVPRVVDFFEKYGKTVKVVGQQNHFIPKPINIIDKLKEINKSPREYQVSAANIALEKKRGIIKICTGGGKTLVAALIAAELGGQIIIYVIGKDLLWQFYDFFTEVFQTKIGVIGDGVCDIQQITIASIWSVGQAFGMKRAKASQDDDVIKEKKINQKHFNEIKALVSQSDVSIMDECHLGAAETMQRIGAAIRSEYTIGMSASPYRDDNAGILIEGIFGNVIVNISASELIEANFLVKPVIRFLPVPRIIGVGKNYRQVYKNFIVNNDIRNNFVVTGGERLVEQGFVTMVLYKEIEHGKILHEMFQEKNIHNHLLNGKMSSSVRRKAVDDVLNGNCKLLLASSIFDIGIDIPLISGLILAGGGKSSIRAIQRIGRVIRPSEGKSMAAILDFNDNCKYLREHSKIRYSIYNNEPGFEVSWKGKTHGR